jgi:hypothetical protein
MEIPVDPGRLYDNDDQLYFHWLGKLLDRVAAQRQKEAAKMKAKAR